jgi:hypothetical protein
MIRKEVMVYDIDEDMTSIISILATSCAINTLNYLKRMQEVFLKNENLEVILYINSLETTVLIEDKLTRYKNSCERDSIEYNLISKFKPSELTSQIISNIVSILKFYPKDLIYILNSLSYKEILTTNFNEFIPMCNQIRGMPYVFAKENRVLLNFSNAHYGKLQLLNSKDLLKINKLNSLDEVIKFYFAKTNNLTIRGIKKSPPTKDERDFFNEIYTGEWSSLPYELFKNKCVFEKVSFGTGEEWKEFMNKTFRSFIEMGSLRLC